MKFSEQEPLYKEIVTRSESDLRLPDLVKRFRDLESVDVVMDKLSSLMVSGETTVESSLVSSLERITGILQGKESSITLEEALQDFEDDLKKYEQWILQNHQIVTAFSLRKHLQNGALKHNDLLIYLKFVIHLNHKTTDDYYKADLLLTRVCDGLSQEETADLIDSLCSSPDPIKPEAQKIVNTIYSVCSELENLVTFEEMIDGSLLGQARALKQELGVAFWHPVAMKAVARLNVTLRAAFERLFHQERQFIRSVCAKFLQRSIRSIALDSGEYLSIDGVMKLVEESEHLLSENYNTNTNTLLKLAKMGAYMRRALNELLEEQAKHKITPNPERLTQRPLEPVLTTPKDMDEDSLRRQLSAQLEIVKQQLAETSNHRGMATVRLAHTPLMLNSKEVTAILSEGKAVESHLLLQEYKMIRTCICVLAEMQESTAVLNSGDKSASSKKYYNVATISLLLAMAQRLQGELEVLSHQAQQENDPEGAIELLTLRRRLQNAHIGLWRVASQTFPVLKLRNIGVYTHN